MRLCSTAMVLGFALGCRPEPPLPFAGPLALVTLNVANGAGDRYRTAENRNRQAMLLDGASGDVSALEEVDVGVDRSGNGNTALQIAAKIQPGFEPCAFELPGDHFSIEGTLRCDAEKGTILFGVGFRADDPFALDANGLPSGIMDADSSLDPVGVDRGSDAYYGNAVIVRRPWSVAAAYTVALPADPTVGLPADLLKHLGDREPNRAALAANNQSVRNGPAIEPRSVLVARLTKPGSNVVSVLITHLESGGSPALRQTQLEAVLWVARAERTAGRSVAILGDFNLPSAQAVASMNDAGFTTPKPSNEIDQIWLDSTFPNATADALPTGGASDHLVAIKVSVP
jgi:endonuclease/exonuclease/phosphatase family metal-dependent hydrolase